MQLKNTSLLLQKAYAFCEDMARKHYENFPAGSVLFPKRLRVPVTVIYAFSRSADDIADEGNLSKEERLQQLAEYRTRLLDPERTRSMVKSWASDQDAAKQPSSIDLIFLALHEVMDEHQLPESLFLDLLSAFEQDIQKKQYRTLDEVKDYCRRSANTIGRLLLHLAGVATPRNLQYADCICTALQLNNFLQDLESDLSLRKRCYLPVDLLEKVQLSPDYLEKLTQTKEADTVQLLFPVVDSILSEIERLLDRGKPLLDVLKGRLAFELRLTMVCAYKIVDKLRARKNPFERPTLLARHWPKLIIQAYFYKPKTKAMETLDVFARGKYKSGKSIAKQSGFYASLLGVSRLQKRAMITLYLFCREVDDIVDEGRTPEIAEIKIHFWLQEIERVFLGNPKHPIGIALAEVIALYPLQQPYFKEILNGMLMDLEHSRYPSFPALLQYCHAVASCVGLLAIDIFGFSGERVALENYARNLGIALQLVNIIRDVGEDVRLGRIYLPEADLLHFGVTVDEIRQGIYSDRFQALMQYQADRAREYYVKALEALPLPDYRSQQPGLIMAAIYFDLLRELEKSNFQVLHQKIKLTPSRKLLVALTTIGKCLFLKPETTSLDARRRFIKHSPETNYE